MLDIKTSTDRLEAIVLFFKDSIEMFKRVLPDISKEEEEKGE